MKKKTSIWNRNAKQRNRRRLDYETLENRRVLAAYISEFHFDPLFGDSEQHQYLEFRGVPGTSMPEGSYFVGIESADGVGELGDVHTVIDLSNIFFGSNGHLVLLQSVKDPGGIGGPPPGYAVNPLANELQGTDGFLGLPGNIFEADGGGKEIHAGTSTYFLVQSDTKPLLTDDIDGDDDGVPDPTGVYANWTIMDGFSIVPSVESPFNQRPFGPIVFSERGAGDGFLPDSVIVRTTQQAYAGRIAGSVGFAETDWLIGNTVEDGDNPFMFQFQHGTFGTPRPEAYGGRFLENIGESNWFGSLSGKVFEDNNENGIQDDGEDLISGAQLQIEHRGNADTFWEEVEPNIYVEDQDISNISPFLTSITTGDDNIPLGFKNEVVQDSAQPVGEYIFSHAGIGFFNTTRKLRIDFYRPARTIEIDAIGVDDQWHVYATLEAYNSNDELMGFVRSGGLRAEVRQTLRISSPNDDIAYVVAYPDEEFMDSNPFGKLDSLRVEFPHVNETFSPDGKYAVAPVYDGVYDVSFAGAPEYYQVFPTNNGDHEVNISLNSHANNVDFGLKLKQPPEVTDDSMSAGELIGAGQNIGFLPVTLGYPGQELEFEILSGDADDQFTINNETFALQSKNGDFDFETKPQFELVIEATDPSLSTLKDQATITVNFTDQNDPPVVTEQQEVVTENSPEGTVVGTTSATDQDSTVFTWSIVAGNVGNAFEINATTGQVTVANSSAVNFEVTPVFNLTVRATDDGNPASAGNGNLRIQLTDVDEIPIVSDEVLSFPENSPTFAHVGFLQLIEPDAGETTTWRIVGEDAQLFDLVPLTGQLRVAEGAEFDFETRSEFSFLAEATDSAVPPKTGSRTVTINVTDVNDAPEIPDQSPSIVENSASGTEVGQISASDQDPGQSLSFAIGGGLNGNVFTISSDGLLSVAEDANINFEDDSTLEVVVDVTDDHQPPATTSKTITVQVEDANDPPT
ncbi:MAG: cadherin domain-containing protein, partial [Planctomycetota bacterium]